MTIIINTIITITITFILHDLSLSLLLFTTVLGIIDLPPFERPFTLIGDHFDKSRSFFNFNLNKKGHNQQSLNSQDANKDPNVSSSIFNPFRWRSPNQYPNQGLNQFTTDGVNDNAKEGVNEDFNEGDDNESLKEGLNHDSSITSSIWDFTKESMKTVLTTFDELTEPIFFHTPKRVPIQTDETINNHEKESNHDHHHHLHIPVIDNLLHHHHHDHHDKQHVVYNVLIGSSYIKGVIAALLMMMIMMMMMMNDNDE